MTDCSFHHAPWRALVVVLCGVAAAACGAGSDGSSNPTARDTLIFSPPADVTTLDPHNTTDSQSDQAILMIYNTLITFDEDMQIVGDLAERWEVAEDGRRWTFHLREGVRFHDGTPFTAEAVRQTFARVLDPEQNHKRLPLFNMLERVEVIDDHTVAIVTEYPFGAFEPTMAHVSAAILNPVTIERDGKSLGYSAEATSGTGPYRVDSWRKDLELVLERNDDYWGEPGTLRQVVYRPIPETAARVIALETGAADVITHIPAPDIARLTDDPDIEVMKTVSIGARGFRFHCQRPPFTDARVRQAISYAIDRRTIVDAMFAGQAIPSTGALTPIIRGYANLGEMPYDPDKARRLLADAGYPNGFKTTISTTSRYILGVELAEAVAAQLAEVGIEAAIDVIEWGTFITKYRGLKPEDNPMEIFIWGAGASTADADWGLRPLFFTHPTNENNYGYYSNAEFDEAITAAMRETDDVQRQALYRRAQEILYLEDPGAVWMFDIYYVIAARADVRGMSQFPLGVTTFPRASFAATSN